MPANTAKNSTKTKVGQWVTSVEADSINFRPVSLGRKLYSVAQHDFNSFKSKLSTS